MLRLRSSETTTQVRWDTTSNGDGRYGETSITLAPNFYPISVQAENFETQMVQGLRLNVESKVSLDFVLHPGAVSQSVIVRGSGININTTDASVSTVIDRRLIEYLPLNGRSFQSLMTHSLQSRYWFAVAGELARAERLEREWPTHGKSNYFTVDGVSANIGASVSSSGYTGAGFAGGTPGETALGTTQSLVSIDALQEFRAATSTYAAEYGRGPGGQFSFQTRSGAVNQYPRELRSTICATMLWMRTTGSTDTQTPNRFPIRSTPTKQFRRYTLAAFIHYIPHLYNGRNRTFFFSFPMRDFASSTQCLLRCTKFPATI